MSFENDKKREHAELADKAIANSDFRRAAVHMATAAQYALALAEKTEGTIRRSYVTEAQDLIDIAEQLQKKAETQKPADARKAVKDETKDSEAEGDWLVTEKPNVHMTDIAGMDDVKAKLAEMVVEPVKHADKAKEWGIKAGGGVLLFGPPGNGKTTMGKAVAGELDAAFLYVDFAQIRSKWHGESEKRLREVFHKAREYPVSVVFLDDVDGLLPRRGGDSVVDNRIVVQFLAEVGGFQESKSVLLLLGATNKPWVLDEAVFSRFQHKIFVGLPDQPAREFIIRKTLGRAPLDPSANVSTIAASMDGYTGRDIEHVMNAARMAGFRRWIAGGSNMVSTAEVECAMKTVPSSATAQMMKQYEEFAKARFR